MSLPPAQRVLLSAEHIGNLLRSADLALGAHRCRGNRLTAADQEAKLRRVAKTAAEVWGAN
jgi:hypothetical protein